MWGEPMRRALRFVCILMSLLVAIGAGQKSHAAPSGSPTSVIVAQTENVAPVCPDRAPDSPGVAVCCFGLCASAATIVPSQMPVLRFSGLRLTPGGPRELTGTDRAPDPFPPKPPA